MNIRIQNKTIKDEVVKLGKSDLIHFITNAKLERCNVEFRTSGQHIVISNATFKDCTIKATPPLNGFQFHGARFENCEFTGTFRGCGFGPRTNLKDWKFGRIRNCSFEDCILDHCSFFSDDANTLRWPGWPHVILLDPLQNTPDWDATPFPPDAKLELGFVDTNVVPMYREIKVETYYLPRQWKGGDPEEIWALIQDKPYATFPGKELKPRAGKSVVDRLTRKYRVKVIDKKKEQEERNRWRALYFARLVSVSPLLSKKCNLEFDIGFLQKKVPDAPSSVIATIPCDVESHRNLAKILNVAGPGKFIIRAVNESGDGLCIKGNRKEFGTMNLPTRKVEYSLPGGGQLDVKKLDRAQAQYWASDYLAECDAIEESLKRLSKKTQK